MDCREVRDMFRVIVAMAVEKASRIHHAVPCSVCEVHSVCISNT